MLVETRIGILYFAYSRSYSIAIAESFQTENFKVHQSDRLPFLLEFRNHNAVLENHSGRATRPRKNLISLSVLMQYRRVMDTQPAIFRQQRPRYAYVRHTNNKKLS